MAAESAGGALPDVAKQRLALCPRVQDLVDARREALTKLRDELIDADGSPLQCPNLPIDDTTMVRFLLAHDDDVEAAAASLRRTVQWRTKKADLLAAVAKGEDVPEVDTIRKHTVIYMYVSSTGGIFLVIRAGRSNPAKLASVVPRPALLDFMLSLRERAFLACDTLTRGTGRLYRATICVDLDGALSVRTPVRPSPRAAQVSLCGKCRSASSRLPARLRVSATTTSRWCDVSAASPALTNHSPSSSPSSSSSQLVERIVLLNPPSFISMILSVARRFLSERTQKLFGECGAASAPKEPGSVASCPFMSRRFLPEDVPDFLGGRCAAAPSQTPLAQAQAAVATLNEARVLEAAQAPSTEAPGEVDGGERDSSGIEG